jgi:hypothetical protein
MRLTRPRKRAATAITRASSVARRQLERPDDVSAMPMLLTVDDASNCYRLERGGAARAAREGVRR